MTYFWKLDSVDHTGNYTVYQIKPRPVEIEAAVLILPKYIWIVLTSESSIPADLANINTVVLILIFP